MVIPLDSLKTSGFGKVMSLGVTLFAGFDRVGRAWSERRVRRGMLIMVSRRIRVKEGDSSFPRVCIVYLMCKW